MSRTFRTTLFLLSLALVACSDDGSGGDPDTSTDVAADAGDDAPDQDVAEDLAGDLAEDPVEDAVEDPSTDAGGDSPIDTPDDLTPDTGSDADTDTVQPDLENQCLADVDSYLLVYGDADPWPIAIECLAGCSGPGRADCALDCTVGALGVREGCGSCLREAADCALRYCDLECVAPSSEDCIDCTRRICGVRYDECTGDLSEVLPPTSLNFVNALGADRDVSAWNPAIFRPIVDELAPGEGASGQTLRGNNPIEFRDAGASLDDDILVTAFGERGYEASTVHTVGIYDDDGGVGSLWIREDLSDSPEGFRYRFVNTAIERDIDVWELREGLEPVRFIEFLGFGEASPDAGRAGGSFVVALDDDQDNELEESFDLGTPVDDSQHTYWILEDESGRFVIDSTVDGTYTRIDPMVDG